MKSRIPFLTSSIAIPLVCLLMAVPRGFAAENTPPAAREIAALPSLAPLVESVKAAVVNVDVQSRGGPRFSMGDEFGDDFFDRFFGRGGRGNHRGQEQLRQGKGSGFIIDPKGLVLTNNHVVQDAVNIRIKLDDGREFEGKVAGRDPLTDVALVRLNGAQNLPAVRLGDSDAMRVGDWVVAIGNPFGLASSVSAGIISAKSRDIGATRYDDFLQTDAAINPGNSGGPLFNLRGEVIGINTAIVGGGTGIGFAVPSNIAKALVPLLEKDGTVSRGYIGVNIQDLTPELAKGLGVPAKEGAVISDVQSGPGKAAGLRPDDVVTAIDGQKVTSARDLSRAVGFKRPGTSSTLTVYRGSKQMEMKVRLDPRPDIEHINAPAERGGNGDEEGDGPQQSGLSLRNVDPRYARTLGSSTDGALIAEVASGSAAERAGLAAGMVITEINKKPVRNSSDAVRSLKGLKSGSTALVRTLTRVPDNSPIATLHALTIP